MILAGTYPAGQSPALNIVLYNRHYERFADFKGAILEFFANIKQHRLNLNSAVKEDENGADAQKHEGF
jgi:hypothetical protein